MTNETHEETYEYQQVAVDHGYRYSRELAERVGARRTMTTKTQTDLVAGIAKNERLVTSAEVGSDPFVVAMIAVVSETPGDEFNRLGTRVDCGQCGTINGPAVSTRPTTTGPLLAKFRRRMREQATSELWRHVALHERELAVDTDPFYGLTGDNS